ncbi:MAG: SCO family protein [Polyangiaceae bacterium]
MLAVVQATALQWAAIAKVIARARVRFATVSVLAILALFVVTPAHAAPAAGGPRQPGQASDVVAGETPPELEGIGIEDKNGAVIPRDIELIGSDGRAFALGEYMDGERPLILVLAYYGCANLCSLVLNGTVEGLKEMPQIAGRDFRVLVVSFDPRDSTNVAHDKRAAYIEALGNKIAPTEEGLIGAFEFATGDPDHVKRLADAVGFRYRWDEADQQYAHAAGIFFITPNAALSQALTGISYSGDDMSSALAEAKSGTWHSPLKSALFYCFKLNRKTGKYGLVASRAMRVGAAATIAVLAIVLFRLFRSDRKRRGALPQTDQSGPFDQGQS